MTASDLKEIRAISNDRGSSNSQGTCLSDRPPEYHELAKRAKDMASGAVLISIISAGLVWLYAILLIVYPNWFL